MSLQQSKAVSATVHFAGGSLAKRLGMAVHKRKPVFKIDISEAVSGGGILESTDGRNNVPIKMENLRNVQNLVLWIGTNDFFAHTKEKQHTKSFKIYSNRDQRKQFGKQLDELLENFNGDNVWIIGLIPRYVNISCCEDHQPDQVMINRIMEFTKTINIQLSKKANYFHKNNKTVMYINPEDLACQNSSIDWKAALAKDSIHLSNSTNSECAKNIIQLISNHLIGD